ncbi:MAG: SH3 domain-containing protein [Chloroflexi bacterium]|nr:SH3 domain-containing protein [Chloroflexota bacterium]
MQEKPIRWPILLPFAILLFASLACGGFQVRVTPTPIPTSAAAATETPTLRSVAPTNTPTRSPTRVPTATPSPAPTQTAGLVVGASARISASGGINIREVASTTGKAVGRLGADTIVTIKGGPTEADNYTWWQVDDGKGTTGWVAAGTKDDPWIVPERGSGPAAQGGKLVNRPIRVGDRVQVTTEEGKMLTVRDAAGQDAPPVARALPGTQYTVRGGPVRDGDYLWWQIEGDQVKGWAAEGETSDRWLTPVEP